MSDEQDRLRVSLEPPKLFGRKKKSEKAKGEQKSADRGAEESRPASPAESDDAREREATAAEPETTAEEPATASSEPEPPAAEPEPDATPAEPEAAEPETPAAEPEDAAAPETAAAEPVEADEPSTEPTEPAATHEPADEPAAQKAPLSPPDQPGATEPTSEVDADLPSEDVTVPPPTQAEPSFTEKMRARFSQERSPGDVADSEAEDAEITSGAYTAPLLAHYPAAALTGTLVGLGMVVLTWLSLRGCEAIRGTASCGGGPGFLLLVGTFIVSVMVGAAVLKSFSVPDPGSTSFLAVGLTAVVSLLLLVDFLDHWSMLIVIPVVSVGGFLLSAYITKTFVEPDES